MTKVLAASAVVRSRIDPLLKKRAEKVMREMGLGMSDGIRLFLAYTAQHQALPFPVRTPNSTTLKAMEEAEKLAARFESPEDLFNDLEITGARKTRKTPAKKR